ncbi:hypothetical protein [Hymenobacter mucosus]|uniref:Uncharacterized protein n=1 Tax=Hymenobacter mucosus TaxID=1411120 RepID=A0A238W649_9BACT|nr:hypothetical protein [Hymenobacter mucosus]SNR41901.1 hypothetical protein SAMN06269173_102256 [Hymenobacter mucosus]
MQSSSSSHLPSVGRSLGILIGALALLWTWQQFPSWYALGHDDATAVQRLQSYWFQPLLLGVVLALANLGVLRWSTLPLALPSSPGSLLDPPRWQQNLVFWACVAFHVASLLGLLLLGSGWVNAEQLWATTRPTLS